MNDSMFLFTETRQLEIRPDGEVPPLVLEMITPYLQKHAWLVPSFVNFIYIRWSDTEESGGALSATVMEEYRRMTFWVHGAWLNNTERGRDTDVRHELLHAITEPLYRFGKKMIKLAALEGKAAQLVEEDLRVAVEKVTCDLQNMIDRHDFSR